MGVSIGIEDLVANALIEVIETSEDKRRYVTFSEIREYGAEVVELLNAQGEQAVLIFSRDRTNTFLRDYSEFFDVVINDRGEKTIYLKEEKDTEDLKKIFRSYLSIDMLMAFMNSRSVQKLGL